MSDDDELPPYLGERYRDVLIDLHRAAHTATVTSPIAPKDSQP